MTVGIPSKPKGASKPQTTRAHSPGERTCGPLEASAASPLTEGDSADSEVGMESGVSRTRPGAAREVSGVMRSTGQMNYDVSGDAGKYAHRNRRKKHTETEVNRPSDIARPNIAFAVLLSS